MYISSDFRKKAREVLQGNWGNCVVANLIIVVILGVVGSLNETTQVIAWILSGPLAFGLAKYFLTLSRTQKTDLNYLFSAFDFSGKDLGLMGRTIGISLLSSLFIFLWSILLIIPGIIAAYSYRMIYFIYVDNPNLGVLDTLKKSKEMMHGNKGKLFLLDLSFLGWIILSLLTFGIGFIWLSPYMFTSHITFYEQLNSHDDQDENIPDQNVTGIID